MTPVKIGKRTAIVGAGNVAMDAARVALRLGAEEVSIIYRRTKHEMPARKEEIERAEEEGIKLLELTLPVKYIAGKDGAVSDIECVKMELGEPDQSGRRSPIEVAGSNYMIPVDTTIVAIGNAANPLIPHRTPSLSTKPNGLIIATPEGLTSIPSVFAGGDITRGAATVISAMGDGKRAARAIDSLIKGEKRGE